MNELTTLQTLRDEVAEPTADQLAPAFQKLERRMQPAKRRRRALRARWAIVGVAGVTAFTLIGGNAAMAAGSARAASELERIAGITVNFSDPTLAPGQYLLAHTHANWRMESLDATGKTMSSMNEQIMDVYVPSDPNDDWVLYRDWGKQRAGTNDGHVETLRGKNGKFYSDPWVSVDLAAIPRGTGAEALAYFKATDNGGSASRDENNFVRITDILRSGLIPADLRAALFEALALIPGVTSTDNVANLDGKKGVAIGRTEALRGGERQEVIIDPNSGLVIGERTIMTVAAFGFGLNEVVGLTAVETRVVDTAP